MKKLRKIASLLLAMVMVVAMSATAFAADSYTITISNTTDGYQYVAYQIFAGDLSDDETTLSNVTWGSNVDTDAEGFETALNTAYSTTDAATIAAAITTTEQAAAFAEVIAPYVTGGASSGTTSPYTITVSEAGYYLVVNTVVPSGNYAYSDYILEVVDDVTVNPKATSTPEFDKTVGSESANDDATEDYAIGDSVPFTLTATLPTSISAYTSYKLVFTDTLSSGLTYDEGSLSVTVGGVELTSEQYSLNVDGQDITVTITDVLSLEIEGVTVGSGTKVVVSYTATLNDNAGSIENNKASLSFSNNPNGDEMGTTEEDKTYVVTFTVSVKKTDSDGTALAGAAFTLYTKDSEGKYTVEVGTSTAGEATTFNFDGLAIGDYMLVESTTPDGYNTVDPIYFTISATATESSTGVDVTITEITDFEITAETLTTTVENNKGSELPSTGGIGTTIFYVLGSIMVLGAAVVLITRRRMGKAE